MKVTNCKQFELLLAELNKKPMLAKGFQRGISPANFKESWEEITVVLNSSGPPSRNSEGWQKVWRDLKCKVKRKLADNRTEIHATGGGRNKQHVLTNIEEAVAALLNFDRQINPSGMCVGFAEEDNNVLNVSEAIVAENLFEMEPPTFDITTAPSSSTEGNTAAVASNAPPPRSSNAEGNTAAVASNARPPRSSNTEDNTAAVALNARPPRRRKQQENSNKENLLENHSKMQENILSEISSTLKELKNYCKDNVRYTRKQYELAQRRAEREEELHEIELQIKKKKMELLDRQLL